MEFVVENWVTLLGSIIALGVAIAGLYSHRKSKKEGDANTMEDKKKQTSNASANHGGISIAVSGDNTQISGINGDPPSETNDKTKPVAKSNDSSKSEYESIQLHDVYTSLFAEDNQLKTERIVITHQEHGKIEGYVELKELDARGRVVKTLSYTLTGVFANKVLTAEYLAKGSKSDERGAINLKLVASNILSGFCSFSKLSSAKDEIRVSPYIWVEGENVDLLDGTYDFCTQCYQEKEVCCCASEYVDMPLFLDTETTAIRSSLSWKQKQKPKAEFSKTLPEPFSEACVRQILRDQNVSEEDTKKNACCHFFDPSTNVCKIYAGRPLDCRLFPFDIKLDASNSEYIIGYYTDLCSRTLPHHSIMKQYAHILRPYFFILYPYLHIFTSDVACERLRTAEFKKIANFKDFVF